MKRLLMVFQIIATGALADGIYLRNCHNRMIYGPIALGARLEVAAGRDSYMRNTYDCVMPSTDEIRVVSNLHATVIPEIEFTNAPIAEVVEKVNKKAHQAGATLLTVKVDLEAYQWRKDILVLCSLSEDSRTNVPAVSLVWRYVSLFTILEEVSRMTDLPVNIVGNEIILSQKTKQQLSNQSAHATGKPSPSR